MIIYGIKFYTIVGHMREILMCYISTIERAKERGISYRIET